MMADLTPNQKITLKFTGEPKPGGKAASALDQNALPPPKAAPPPTPELRPEDQAAAAPAPSQPAQQPAAPAAPAAPQGAPQQPAAPQQQPTQPAQQAAPAPIPGTYQPPSAAPAPAPTPAPAPAPAAAPGGPTAEQQQEASQLFQQADQQNQAEQAQAQADPSVKMAPADPANNWPAEPQRIRDMRLDEQKAAAEQAKEKYDALNPPVEFPILKMIFGAAGYMGGGAVGTGGDPANLPGMLAGEALGSAGGVALYNTFQNIWDTISGNKNAQGEPVSFTQQTLDALKTGLMVYGGGRGTSLAEAAGGNTLMRMAGGAAGTAVSTFTADQIAAMGKFWGMIPPEERTPTMREALIDAVQNGGLDLLINMAMRRPLKTAGVATAQWLFGIGPQELEAAATAARHGIYLSMNNLSEEMIPNLYRNVMTRLIPYLAGPYKKRFLKQLQEGHQAVDRLPERAGGGIVPTSTEIGQRTINAANRALDATYKGIDDKFNRIMVQATDAGASFNTEFKAAVNQDGVNVPSLKDWARGILKKAKAGALYTKTGKSVTKTPLTQLANDILAMKQYAFPEELNSLARRVDKMYGSASDADRKTLDSFTDSLYGSYQDSKSLKSPMRDFGWEFQQNMREAANAKKTFETQAGEKLKGAGIRTSRGSVKANMSPDVAGDALFNMKDPEQVRELRKRVGDDIMNEGAAYFLQKQIKQATKNGLFDPEAFARDLSLDTPGTPQYEALKEALKTSDVSLQDVQEVVNSFRNVLKNAPADPAAMIARAAILGHGIAGIIKYVFPAGILEGGKGIFGKLSKSPIKSSALTIGALVLMKRFSKIASNPQYLREASTFFNANAATKDRIMAYTRLVRAVYHDEIDALSYRSRRMTPLERAQAAAASTRGDSSFLMQQSDDVPSGAMAGRPDWLAQPSQ